MVKAEGEGLVLATQQVQEKYPGWHQVQGKTFVDNPTSSRPALDSRSLRALE